jgi:hypothetical protein
MKLGIVIAATVSNSLCARITVRYRKSALTFETFRVARIDYTERSDFGKIGHHMQTVNFPDLQVGHKKC